MYDERAKDFIYRNARPLEIARWKYLFEGGSRNDVLTALAAYQNADGGFGHALEPDCWNPHSSPVQTWVATEILKELRWEDQSHPIVQGILRYLASGDAFDGHTWLRTIPSNNHYPHAPWWDDEPIPETSYNPTASLIGFILKFAAPGSALFSLACKLAQEAYRYLKEQFPLESMHTASCFLELYESMKESPVASLLALDEFEALLHRQIRYVVTDDSSKWGVDYVCKPSLLIHSKVSAFYWENKDVCEEECKFILNTQEPDGSWKITWSWEAYPEQWSISKNWWKSDVIIKNVRFVKAICA